MPLLQGATLLVRRYEEETYNYHIMQRFELFVLSVVFDVLMIYFLHVEFIFPSSCFRCYVAY